MSGVGRHIRPVPLTAVPIVFDRALIRTRLARARRAGRSNFLMARVVEDLLDRLEPVQRRFDRVLDLGSPWSDAADRLASSWQEAVVVRAAPLPEPSGAGPTLRLVGDEERQPFRSECFDLAVSLLSLQTANDLPGALAQIRHVLKPDGLFLGALLGGQTLQELRRAMAQAEAELNGGASPRVAPFADLRDLGQLLQRAGLALPVTDIDRIVVRYDSLFGLMRDLRDLGLTNALADRNRRPPSRRLFVRAAEIYAAQYADADGRVRATFDIIWLSGWAPHESQQKPLRPGSARARLADALGVREELLDGDVT